MTARDLGVNAHQHSVRRTARERPQVKYTIDMRSDDNSDSEESRDGDQEQLSRFQTSLGIRMCAADPSLMKVTATEGTRASGTPFARNS